MKAAFRSALLVTFFTFSAQLLLFVVQVVSAAFFGAGSEMDAYLTASTIPQYLVTVLLGSLGFAFIPFFVDFKSKGREDKAYELAVILFNNTIFFLGIITVIGILLTTPLMHAIAPGLDESVLSLSARLSVVVWPSILATGAFYLLQSVYQAEKKFGWQAAVPLIGAVLNLLLLVILAPTFGVMGLAIGTTMGAILQAILLMRVLVRNGRYSFKLGWKNDDLHRIAKLAAPLIFVSLITKFTPVIDRYLASGLSEGSISYLGYSFKIITTLSLLISVGGSTVIFPRMALDAAGSDPTALRSTVSMGLKTMWFIVAPVVTIGIAIALPIVVTLFNYGKFGEADSASVASLLQIYIIALAAMCLGTITGRVFYVLKDSKTLAIAGPLEMIGYAIYTWWLARWLGIAGIAVGYVIYFNVSLIWQLIFLNFRTGKGNERQLLTSIFKTFFAAVIAGAVAYGTSLLFDSSLLQAGFGGVAGLISYALVLLALKSGELDMIRHTLLRR